MIIQVENTSTCQAACQFCVYPVLNRAGGRMKMDLFKKIVDESTEVKISQLLINGLGEPLLDRDLEKRVAYAHEQLYGVPVGIYTNGQFLTPERFKQLKAAGLNQIVVSLNAVTQEQHEEIMGLKGKFYETCENVKYAIDNSDRIRIEVHAVYNGETFKREHSDEFKRQWGKNANVVHEGNWAGDLPEKREINPNSYCFRSDQSMYITFDGQVTTCCFDPDGSANVFGDCNTSTLREIDESVSYSEFRAAHREERAGDYDICRTCTRI